MERMVGVIMQYPINRKAIAALTYIEHFGIDISNKIPNKNLQIDRIHYDLPSKDCKIEIKGNWYYSSCNQFGFCMWKGDKNEKIFWSNPHEPSFKFNDLVEISLPLWESYICSKKPYAELEKL
jgi:hypothetical protein